MATVAAILTAAAAECSVTAPPLWATATDLTHVELRDVFLRQTVEDCQDRIDWPSPIGVTTTITGTGVEGYALPGDFRRLMRDTYAVYERNRTRRECIPVPTDGEWEYMKELGTAGAYRFYRQKGYEGAFTLDFYRPLETGITIVVSYVSENWIPGKAAFTAETDVALFPRRLLEAGVVWRFRKRRGLEYADALAEYEMLMARYANDRRTRRVVSFGHIEGRNPWDVPVPDFIPPG